MAVAYARPLTRLLGALLDAQETAVSGGNVDPTAVRGTVDEVEHIVPGLERDLTVTLAVGQYTFVCALPGHEEQGMTGSLTVH